ncbi:CAP domain-containing protein, partial [Staphylococcus aureus]
MIIIAPITDIDIHINKETISAENKLDTPKKQQFAFNNI